MTIASGTSLPGTPNEGELFYLTSGNIGLHVYDSSQSNWIQVTTDTGVNGGGSAPDCFSVKLTGNQTLSVGVITKLQLNSVVFDTAGSFNSTLYRHVPTVAGKYKYTFKLYAQPGTNGYAGALIYKNGTVYSTGQNLTNASSSSVTSVNDVMIDMNGTTDYVEFFAVLNGTAVVFGGNANTFVNGMFVHA